MRPAAYHLTIAAAHKNVVRLAAVVVDNAEVGFVPSQTFLGRRVADRHFPVARRPVLHFPALA